MTFDREDPERTRQRNDSDYEQIIWQEDSGDIIWTEDYEDIYKPTEKSIREFCDERNISPKELFKPVYILQEARTRLIRHLETNLSIEQGGILFGNVYNDSHHGIYTEITAAVAAPDTVGSSAHLEFTPDSWQRIMDYAKDAHPQENIVGWYHSHPNLGVFMSGTDMRTQTAFFNHPWCVSIVCDPVKKEIGYFLGKQAQRVRDPVVFQIQSRKRSEYPRPGVNAMDRSDYDGESYHEDRKKSSSREFKDASTQTRDNERRKNVASNSNRMILLLFFIVFPLLIISIIILERYDKNSKLLIDILQELETSSQGKNQQDQLQTNSPTSSTESAITDLEFNIEGYVNMSVSDFNELKNNPKKYQTKYFSDFTVVTNQEINIEEQETTGQETQLVAMVVSSKGDVTNVEKNIKLKGQVSRKQESPIQFNEKTYDQLTYDTLSIDLGKLGDTKNNLIPLFTYEKSPNGLVSSKIYIPSQIVIVYKQPNNDQANTKEIEKTIDIEKIGEQLFREKLILSGGTSQTSSTNLDGGTQ